jgi:hypothetical protein
VRVAGPSLHDRAVLAARADRRLPGRPSAEWAELAGLLEQSLNQSKRNLDDTAQAIKTFLNSILDADDGARGRLDRARQEMEGIGDGT